MFGDGAFGEVTEADEVTRAGPWPQRTEICALTGTSQDTECCPRGRPGARDRTPCKDAPARREGARAAASGSSPQDREEATAVCGVSSSSPGDCDPGCQQDGGAGGAGCGAAGQCVPGASVPRDCGAPQEPRGSRLWSGGRCQACPAPDVPSRPRPPTRSARPGRRLGLPVTSSGSTHAPPSPAPCPAPVSPIPPGIFSRVGSQSALGDPVPQPLGPVPGRSLESTPPSWAPCPPLPCPQGRPDLESCGSQSSLVDATH